MGILALLAVFTADAAGATAAAFALVYAAFLAVMAWQWYSVRGPGRAPEFLRITAVYVGGMAISVVVVARQRRPAADAAAGRWAGVRLAGSSAFIGFGRSRSSA